MKIKNDSHEPILTTVIQQRTNITSFEGPLQSKEIESINNLSPNFRYTIKAITDYLQGAERKNVLANANVTLRISQGKLFIYTN